MVHHVVIPPEHTALGIAVLQHLHAVAEIQPPEVAFPLMLRPQARLVYTGDHSLHMNRELLPKLSQNLQKVYVRASGHTAQIPKAALPAQGPKLSFHLDLQRYTPWIQLVFSPGELLRAVAGEGAGQFHTGRPLPFLFQYSIKTPKEKG